MSDLAPITLLREIFGARLQENVSLAHFTSARVGGSADALLPVNSVEELADGVTLLCKENIPFLILGGGSNVLVSDLGVRRLIVLNRARNIKIEAKNQPPTVLAESGANLGALARQVALRGLGGLEWAANIPGTVGGAVYGNAGAFGGNIQESLLLAEILHPQSGRDWWPVNRLGYQYRNSTLKSDGVQAVVLSARLKLVQTSAIEVQTKIEAFSEQRRKAQPPGASMGSMFKNPAGDYAGRLIESVGLKGYRSGDAEISSIHANFVVNHGQATASDIWNLIQISRNKVAAETGVDLELEIELIGDWTGKMAQGLR